MTALLYPAKRVKRAKNTPPAPKAVQDALKRALKRKPKA